VALSVRATSVPGTLRQEVLIDGQYRLVTDEPAGAGGEGTGPSPHELFPAALASCISTTLVMYGRVKEWELGEVSVDVVYHPDARPRRFEIDISIGAELAPEQLERISKIGAACPIHRALAPSFEFVERVQAGQASATSSGTPPASV
jgi:putative redox protein